MLIIIIAMTLIGVVALVVIMNFTDTTKTKEPTIDEIIEYSVETEKITTNLLDNNFIVVKFKIQTDSKKAKEELTKRMFQVKNIIIEEMSSMKTEQFKGKEGIIELENIIKMQINEVMTEGTVEEVYVIDFVIQ